MNYLELSPTITRAQKKRNAIASFIYKGRGEDSQEEKVFARWLGGTATQSTTFKFILFALRRFSAASCGR
jgi:hypothetical protein